MNRPALRESVLPIEQDDRRPFGILHHGEPDARLGVVVVVGGGQYRVGAHRQFVRLARFLAARGVPTLRFDVRGMGDSDGERRHFLDLEDDLRAAIDALDGACPTLDGVVLWGLCDGASAAITYATNDARVHGVAMVNPWISTERGQARASIRHYYSRQLLGPTFWRKLASGQVSLPDAARSLVGTIRAALSSHPSGGEGASGDDRAHELPDLLFAALSERDAPTLIVVSSDDLTAREFESELNRRVRTGRFTPRRSLRVERVTADHTFSTESAHIELCELGASWIGSLAPEDDARAGDGSSRSEQ